MPRQNTSRFRWLWLLLSLLVLMLIPMFIPWQTGNLTSQPNPAKDYLEALHRLNDMRFHASPELNPLCQPQLLDQGQPVEKAIILVHGYTSCPQQFMELGKRFYNLGYNVLLVPMPHHGLSNRMTTDHAELTAEELTAYADEVVDIAQGLGEKVIMAGLSVGGVVTAFAGTHREDLDLAVLISPAFGYKAVPTLATAAAMNAFSVLPDDYGWWDETKQEQGGVPHGYPRYSQRALAQSLRLSFAARRSKPLAGKVIVVTNPNDAAVNNDLTYQTIKRWRRQGVNLITYEFPMELQLDHDLIEPGREDAQIEVVYPKLIELVEDN